MQQNEDEDMEDRLEEMLGHVEQESHRPHVFDSLKSDSKEPLYPGCTKFTRLSAVLRLLNVKARNGWTDKSFTELLELLKEIQFWVVGVLHFMMIHKRIP